MWQRVLGIAQVAPSCLVLNARRGLVRLNRKFQRVCSDNTASCRCISIGAEQCAMNVSLSGNAYSKTGLARNQLRGSYWTARWRRKMVIMTPFWFQVDNDNNNPTWLTNRQQFLDIRKWKSTKPKQNPRRRLIYKHTVLNSAPGGQRSEKNKENRASLRHKPRQLKWQNKIKMPLSTTFPTNARSFCKKLWLTRGVNIRWAYWADRCVSRSHGYYQTSATRKSASKATPW